MSESVEYLRELAKEFRRHADASDGFAKKVAHQLALGYERDARMLSKVEEQERRGATSTSQPFGQ